MAESKSTARENILERIRQANSRPKSVSSRQVSPGAIFPQITNPRQRFLEECAGNMTEVFQSSDAAESMAALETILSTIPAGDIFVQDDPALHAFATVIDQWRRVRLSSQGAPPESTQASLTLAHAFVAQTGSILTSSFCGGRGASIVPPCHIVYGRGSQIIPDIAAALLRVQKEITGASYTGLITGSSRTADIEKILVQGAHGPRRLAIILES